MKEDQKYFLRSLPKNLLYSLKEYTGESFADVNSKLRSKSILKQSEKQIADNIDAIFDLTSPLLFPVTLYRGIRDPKEVKTNSGFISTSYDISSAKEFTRRNCCLIIISVPPGSKILFIESVSELPDEKEVLLDRNGDFNITLVKETRMLYGVDEIYVSYIPHSSVQVKSEQLDEAIDDANIQLQTIARIVNIFPEDEYILFQDNEDILRSSITDLYKKMTENNKPSENILTTILRKIKEKYN